MNTLATIKKYRHRDVDWLSFNDRVLQEAQDKSNPLYERIKFLAIFSSNLDEFFKVRVSQLRQIKRVEKGLRKRLSLKPNKTLKKILERVQELQEEFGQTFTQEILPGLQHHGIFLIERAQFTTEQDEHLAHYFDQQIKESLSIRHSDEVDHLYFEDGQLYLTVVFHEEERQPAFVSVPAKEVGRFVEIPSKDGNHYITYLEEVIKQNLHKVFPDNAIENMYVIKLSRDAELYLDEEYEGELAQQIYNSLSQRSKGQPTRLLYDSRMPKEALKQVRKILGLGKIDMIPGGKHHNFSDFFGFPNPTSNPALHDEALPQLPHLAFEQESDYFKLISKKDQILHLPYQTFEYLQDWVHQAATDPAVKSIKISLYRVAKRSALAEALLLAIEKGKEVTIFVEAQARFDEKNNLKWGKIFEEKGAKVLYSIPNIKVHSKILLIERAEHDQYVHYAYIGTGNFNAKTAKLYCDHGLFTKHPKITGELKQVFEVLERKIILPKVKHLLVSPFTTRTTFEALIQNEIDTAQAGKAARIVIKMNSLEDHRMIDHLYRASQAGVEIELIVRGFCCLIPQVPGLSDHIQVTSIVDRFLEHARVYLFHNGGSEKMYIGSADWMTRNLDRRVEVLTPILDNDIFVEMKEILDLQLSDNVKARIIDDSSENSYVNNSQQRIRSQHAIYEYIKHKHNL